MPLLIRSGIDPWKGSRGPAQFEGQRIAAVKDELDQNAMPGVLEHAISAKISRLPRPHQCPTWELLRSDAGCDSTELGHQSPSHFRGDQKSHSPVNGGLAWF